MDAWAGWFAALAVLGTLMQVPSQSLPNEYRNDKEKFTIRYPDGIRPRERDAKDFGALDMGWETVVDFVSSEPNAHTVLRVIAVRPKLPTYRPLNFDRLRSSKHFREMNVGGRKAATCVTCGRAACSWTVHVTGLPELRIVSQDREASAAREPQDGAYPLKSMIDSIRFEPTLR